jgi:glycosyltransferase involved in cell wall biosynthesis
MRFLLFSPGSTIHTERFTELLLNSGHEVVLVDEKDPGLEPRRSYRFIQLRAVYLRGERFRPVGKLGQMIRRRQFKSLIDQIRPDVVHVHWIDFRADICAQLNIHPLVFTVWGTDINRLFVNGKPLSGCEDIGGILARADLITADSYEILRRCELLSGRKLNSCIFHLGVDLDAFQRNVSKDASALRSRLDIPPHWKVILNARRIHPSLGAMHMINAFTEVSRDLPDLCLVLRQYNSDPNLEQRLLDLIERMGLGSRIFWLKECSYSEVAVHYAIADVVVNYPDEDAFPVSLMEAACARRYIVTSDLPVYREVFCDEVCYVAAGQPTLLARALKNALSKASQERSCKIEAAARIAGIVSSPQTNLNRLMQCITTLQENSPTPKFIE